MKGHEEFKFPILGATTSEMVPETKGKALLNTEDESKGNKKIKCLDGKKRKA